MHVTPINGRVILSRRVINLDTASLRTPEARENDRAQARAKSLGFGHDPRKAKRGHTFA